MTADLFKKSNIGFIGTGNMGQAIIRALIKSQKISSDRLFATNRTQGKLQKLVDQLGIRSVSSNEELLEKCDIVVLALKPQDFISGIEPITSCFTEHHTVLSLLAGVSLKSLKKTLPGVKKIVRIMPNAASVINQTVVGYCLAESARGLESSIENLLNALGMVVPVNEGEEWEALTVSCASGIGFVYELMIYWQEWLEEHGFEKEMARNMTVQTFLGASMLAEQSREVSLQELQNRVVSRKGVTAAGLNSMRELELERGLRYSFEKAVLRDRELGQTSV